MPLLKSFSDSCGNDYAQALWRVVSINIDAVGQGINLTFYAYKDAAAFAAGKQPLRGGTKSYRIIGSEFSSIAALAPVGATLYDVLAHASESYAIAKLDIDSGAKDSGGNPVMVSFFSGASQI